MTHHHSPFVSVGGYFQSPPTGVLSSATSRPHDSTTFPLFCTSETVVPRTKELCIKSMTSVTTSNECENPHDSKKNHRHLQGLNRLWDHEKIPEVLSIFRTGTRFETKNRNFTWNLSWDTDVNALPQQVRLESKRWIHMSWNHIPSNVLSNQMLCCHKTWASKTTTPRECTLNIQILLEYVKHSSRQSTTRGTLGWFSSPIRCKPVLRHEWL